MLRGKALKIFSNKELNKRPLENACFKKTKIEKT
jgi:hypothetical protein